MKIRTYAELITIPDYQGRLNYLKLDGTVGVDTFGFDRVFNQRFYRSQEWKHVRRIVIARDLGCDLGLDDYEIIGRLYVHHMNPITIDDISESTPILLNPNFLITVSQDTHNFIHYGHEKTVPLLIERSVNDTCPWKNR